MSQQTQECPQLQTPCRCAPSIYEPVAIICESAGSLGNALQAIQAAKNIRIDSLSIVDTAVSTLPANAFLDFTILRLVLNRNTLAQIDDLAFNGPLLDSLVELDLSDNQLQQIPAIGLPRLRNLRKLYLNRNRISTLQPQAFAGYASKEVLLKLELAGNKLNDQAMQSGQELFRALKSLQELSLETNALTQVPSQALEAQRNTLTNLNLGLNQIREVPVGALNFPQLTSLSLEFNGITMIIPQAFQQVPHLQYLYLTGNKFPSWQPEMFRFINELRTLGIGETPIAVIPSNAFVHTPNLIRLEMSEAAVDTIEPGAFQRTPLIQAIVFNKNRLTRVRSDMFQGLNELYSLDLQGNRLEEVEPLGFANLPSLRHLDLSYNQLQTMPMNSLDNSFEPVPNDRRVIYACANPWLCDSRLEWFRQLLRDNLDIDIDKPGCVAACGPSFNNCPPEGTPLRSQDFCPIADNPLPLTGTALSLVGWIILAVIMTILLISICLMALIRYGMSHRRKKQKDQELEDEQRIMSSAASAYHQQHHFAGTHPRSFHSTTGIDLDLPAAHNLDDRQNYFI
ncbi:leucine rich repeat domain-containing protein [Ditylenchus destructor]|uniref:Leucine rich repeat domain-containing protein n=1 Tax=Ditylenchus destructor TaxID=166010 RepID=A0AAD4QVZ0_9BILA|nr:leucine rich repeat domain-containing protein [Ditylenchus destructor]